MNIRVGVRLLAAVTFAAMAASTPPLAAQQGQPSGPPNALQGFSQSRDQPIKINSETLEVRDRDKVATFSGNVHLVQGETTLHSNILVVFYENDPTSGPKPPPGAPSSGSSQQIRRVEAKGEVIVVQKDQTATGDNGVFDMKANTVTLVGNVVVSQGPNNVKGDRLTVDLTTDISHVECDKTAPSCRVQALVQPNAAKQEPRPAAQPSQPSGPPNALQGFSQNRDQPIKVTSATLEVHDRDKIATFSGDVHLVQGDTTLRSNILVVYYENDPAAPKPPAGGAGAASSQQVRRLEAKGDVIVVQKDQTATGDNGVFEMSANTVALVGNVVISQRQDVVKGDRLTVDLTSGVSHVECEKTATSCRVQALIHPNVVKQEPHPAESSPPGRDATRQRAPATSIPN